MIFVPGRGNARHCPWEKPRLKFRLPYRPRSAKLLPVSRSKSITFPCNVAAGRAAGLALRQFLAEQGFSDDVLFACELSLAEACNNAVHHATPDQRQQSVTAEARLNDGWIELTVIDHTNGFDWPGTIPPPDPNINAGRGLYLIQSMMDEVSYTRSASGNRMQMRKRMVDRER